MLKNSVSKKRPKIKMSKKVFRENFKGQIQDAPPPSPSFFRENKVNN